MERDTRGFAIWFTGLVGRGQVDDRRPRDSRARAARPRCRAARLRRRRAHAPLAGARVLRRRTATPTSSASAGSRAASRGRAAARRRLGDLALRGDAPGRAREPGRGVRASSCAFTCTPRSRSASAATPGPLREGDRGRDQGVHGHQRPYEEPAPELVRSTPRARSRGERGRASSTISSSAAWSRRRWQRGAGLIGRLAVAGRWQRVPGGVEASSGHAQRREVAIWTCSRQRSRRSTASSAAPTTGRRRGHAARDGASGRFPYARGTGRRPRARRVAGSGGGRYWACSRSGRLPTTRARGERARTTEEAHPGRGAAVRRSIRAVRRRPT